MREQVLNAKENLVSEIKDKFTNAQSAVIVEYRGLSVAEITELRSQLFQEGVDFKVYKNTMTRRAVEGTYDDLLESLTGPNAIAFSDDAVAPSRVLAKFAKKNKKLVIKQGIVEGNIVDVDKIKELSDLPNKEGMLAMLLGALQSPLRDFAWAVKQISEQKPEDGSAESVEETVAEVEEKEAVEASEEAVAEAEVVEEVKEETETQPEDEESTEEK